MAGIQKGIALLSERDGFSVRGINNRRFMYNHRTYEILFGGSDIGISSHAEEWHDSGAKGQYDDCVRGWIGWGGRYRNGVIHFAPPITSGEFDAGYDALQMFKRHGATGKTMVRNFMGMGEKMVDDILNPSEMKKVAMELMAAARELVSDLDFSTNDRFEEYDRLEALAKKIARGLTEKDFSEWKKTLWSESGRYDINKWPKYLMEVLGRGGFPVDVLKPLRKQAPAIYDRIGDIIFGRLEGIEKKWEREQAAGRGTYAPGQRYVWRLKVEKATYWTGEEPWEEFYGGANFVDEAGRKYVLNSFTGQVASGQMLKEGQWVTVSASFSREKDGMIVIERARFKF